MRKDFLPFSPPFIGDEEVNEVVDTLWEGWITTLGPHIDAFEREICQRVGIGYGAVLNRVKKTERLDESLIFVQN
jgi:dTDP-4-amino-4,6-dideoxygalactose transaminase